MSELESLDMLQYLQKNGIVDLSSLRSVMIMNEEKMLLSKHQYKIWNGKDGSWYTYFPDENGGRKLKKRKTKEDLEKMIIEFYRESSPTFDEVFHQWVDPKLDVGEITIRTYQRYCRDFTRYFVNTGMNSRKIVEVSEDDLEKFIKTTIKDLNITMKAWTNFRLLLRGIYYLALRKKLVAIDIDQFLKSIQLSKRLFKTNTLDKDNEVFSEEEIPVIISRLKEDVDKKTNLGLLLIFATGIRIGELAAIKWSDISGNTIHIRRMEVRYDGDDDQHFYDVVDYPKTEAGNRYVVVPDESMWILVRAERMKTSEYVFSDEFGNRINSYSFRNRLYHACKQSGIKSRSPHKIRKTYGTNLIDSDVSPGIIIEQMGHKDVRCTEKYYFYSNKSKNTKDEQLNRAAFSL